MIKHLFLLMILLFSIAEMKSQDSTHVYVFVAEECPISIYMAKPLREVIDMNLKDVQYHAVFPKNNSTISSSQAFLDEYNLKPFNIILDPEQELCKKMEATITPEVVITNAEGIILYRGRISDAYRAPGKMKHGLRKNDLKEVLTKLLANQTIQTPWPHAIGCYITFHN